jgi:integrase
MASITKHEKGYRAFVFVNGKRRSKVFRTRREADSWAAATESQLRASNAPNVVGGHTLRELVECYLRDVAPAKRAYENERYTVLAWLRSESFPADMKLARLRTIHIAAWRDARLKEVAPSTVLRELTTLSSVFEHGRRELEWIERNPTRDLRKPTEPKHRERVIAWTELRGMLRQVGYSPRGAVDATNSNQLTIMCMLFALRTGMRDAEITGLTWDRVHTGHCVLPVTKTEARDVPLTRKALRIVAKMKGLDEQYVFPITARRVSKQFASIRKRAKLSGFKFHDTRHTAATWIAGRMVSNNLPAQQALLDLCKMFGWKDLSRALTYYNPKAEDIAKRIR